MDKLITNKLETFFSQFKLLNLKKGELVIRPDDHLSAVYFLKTGYVRMYTIFEDGRELTLNIFKPGTFFPMMWALSNLPNNYHFQAMTRIEFHKAPREEVVQLLKINPDVLFDLTKRILVGLDGLFTNIQHMLSGSASHRVMATIFLLAKRFGEKTASGEIIIKLRLTHQDLANLAGITRETTSLEIGKLSKEKLLSVKDHLLIVKNIEKLEEELLI